jgi:glucokinase
VTNRSPLAIGIDLGGTKIAAVLVDETGGIVTSAREATAAGEGPDAIVAHIARIVEDLASGTSARELLGVSVGVAGQIDLETGTVHRAPNLDWTEYPFGERLRARTGLRTAVLNDVQAATYGEWIHGAAREAHNAVCIFVGTGVGGGLIAGGCLQHGAGGSAGEVGHMTIDMQGPVCRCGNRGCLEAYAGGWAIARRAFDAVQAHQALGSAILEVAGNDPRAISAAVVAEAAHTGDPLARALVREVGEALAAASISVVNALNPEVLILGGGVVDGLPELTDTVRERVAMWALPSAGRDVRVLRSRLGANSGAVGAAAWLRYQAAGSADAPAHVGDV